MASKTYPKVVREKIVALARSGRSLTSLAREFEPSVQTIRKWVEQARREERLENMDIKRRVRKLEREVARVREERDILLKYKEWVEQQDKLKGQ
ncbi:MAG: transposase [Gammaproteobacteria bacterium]|nr:transposase [Gammaproteobacteria bacterium]